MLTDEPGVDVDISTSRDRILDVAHELFLGHGYRAVSMNQIAAAASIKKSTLYHHFRDKEDLFVAVMRTSFERSREALVRAMDPDATLREQLQRVAAHVFASSQSNFGRLVIDFKDQVSEERRAELMGEYPPPWVLIQPAISAAVASGEIRPVDEEVAGMLFFTTVWGHVWLARIGTYEATLDEQYAANLVDLMIDGLGVCPPDPSRAEPPTL